MSMRVVVVMVRVIRGQGLLAIMTDDLSSHIQEAEALLLQCCRDVKHTAKTRKRQAEVCVRVSEIFQVSDIHTEEASLKLIYWISAWLFLKKEQKL